MGRGWGGDGDELGVVETEVGRSAVCCKKVRWSEVGSSMAGRRGAM